MKLLQTLAIGRSAEADVQLEHDTISRRHARLELLSGARMQLTDLQSSNGTWVKRGDAWEALKSEEINADQQLRFGEFEIALREILEQFPAFAVVLEALEARGEGLELSAGPVLPRHDKPRRNPGTGDIEDAS